MLRPDPEAPHSRWLHPSRRVHAAVTALAVLAAALTTFCLVYANWETAVGGGSPSIKGVDDTGYYIWGRSLMIDGDLDFANDVATAPTLADDMREVWLTVPRSAAGRVINKYPPGWAVANAPAILAGHLWARLTGAPADGWSTPYFFALWIWHLVTAFAGLWWAWRVVSRFASAEIAALAVLAIWVASPQLYYSTGRPGLTHGIVFTLTAAMMHQLFLILEGRGATWRWALIGGMAGLGMIVRPTSLCYLAFPAVVCIRCLSAQPLRRRVAMVAATGAPLLAAPALWVTANILVRGSPWDVAYPGESFDFSNPRLLTILFSHWHGLLYWHPLVGVGAIGLFAGIGRRDLPISWGVSALAIWYVNASWWHWSFGSSYGNRAFEGVLLPVMAGFAWLLVRASRIPILMTGMLGGVGVTAAASAVLLVLFVLGEIPREVPVSHTDMLAAATRLVSNWFGVGPGG